MMILDFLFVPHYAFFNYKSIQRYCIYVSICIYLGGRLFNIILLLLSFRILLRNYSASSHQ